MYQTCICPPLSLTLFCLLAAIPRETHLLYSLVFCWEETQKQKNLQLLSFWVCTILYCQQFLCHRRHIIKEIEVLNSLPEAFFSWGELNKRQDRRMSAKLLYSLTDDKKHMKNQNQMGCMNGLFQLFDRHHFMGGRRVNHKRLPPQGDNQQTQMENASHKAKGDNSRHDTKDRHRESCESPRATVSSSSCASIHTSSSSTKTATQRAAYGTPFMLHTEYGQSPISNRGSDHLRDIVKESINREVPGLVVKTPADKSIRNVVKHIDSPRPSILSMPIKPKYSGLDESFKKLRKFQEIHNEGKDRSLLMTRREGHRFSCDARVTNSQDTLKSTLKLKEQPRLSLDSRASSTRRRLENDNCMSQKLEKPDSCKHTSIVAKLMGLDITTESTVTGNNSESNEPSNADNASEQAVASYFHKDPSKNSIQVRNRDTTMKPVSASRLLVEPAPWKDLSSGLRKPGFGEATKNVPNLMVSVYGEMEKWVTELEFKKSSSDLRALKQILGAMQKSKENLEMKKELASDSVSQSHNKNKICRSNRQELKSADSLNLSGNFSQTITSGSCRHPKRSASPIVVTKPAHAVISQQIKTSAECRTEGFSGLRKLRTTDDGGQSHDSTDKHMPSRRTLTTHHRDASSPTLRTDNSSISSPKTARIKTTKLTQPLAAERNNAARSSGVVSPRLQQRQLRFEKKVQQTSLPSEPTRTTKQPSDVDSPAKRTQLRASSLQKHGGNLAEVRIRSSSSIQLEYSSKSDSNISQSSEFVSEVTNIADLDEMEAAFFRKRDITQENKTARSDKCRPIVELNIIAPEQPSPVSVLDAMFYRDESPSPVKKISNAFIDYESFNPEEQGWATKRGTSDSSTSFASTNFDTERVYNGEQLFEEQVDLYSTTFGNSADCGLPLSDSKNQDHEYIYEILLASGLLQESQSGLKTIQPHQSGYAIRPGIFMMLEMKNAKRDSSVNTLNNNTVSKESVHADKIQRKLIFDIVNEILGRKVLQSNYKELSLLSSRVADISKAKQKLLKDTCSEIQQLQVTQSKCNYDEDYDEFLNSNILDDMQKHGPNGSGFHGEISALVLDVERLIFKDLISEIISDAAEDPRIRYNGHHRQLFCI